MTEEVINEEEITVAQPWRDAWLDVSRWRLDDAGMWKGDTNVPMKNVMGGKPAP